MPGGQEMNACALSCPLNWATNSNMDFRMTVHQLHGCYAVFQS
jgi:hypothetical protein